VLSSHVLLFHMLKLKQGWMTGLCGKRDIIYSCIFFYFSSLLSLMFENICTLFFFYINCLSPLISVTGTYVMQPIDGSVDC
jgi:hypothetical protein